MRMACILDIDSIVDSIVQKSGERQEILRLTIISPDTAVERCSGNLKKASGLNDNISNMTIRTCPPRKEDGANPYTLSSPMRFQRDALLSRRSSSFSSMSKLGRLIRDAQQAKTKD